MKNCFLRCQMSFFQAQKPRYWAISQLADLQGHATSAHGEHENEFSNFGVQVKPKLMDNRTPQKLKERQMIVEPGLIAGVDSGAPSRLNRV